MLSRVLSSCLSTDPLQRTSLTSWVLLLTAGELDSTKWALTSDIWLNFHFYTNCLGYSLRFKVFWAFSIFYQFSFTHVLSVRLTHCLSKYNLFSQYGEERKLCVKDVSPYFPKVATHSTILAWRIPWTEEPGGLRSRGLPRAGHKRSDLAHMHARRRQTKLPNPVSSPLPSSFLLHCAASLFIKYISDSVYYGEVHNLS